MSDQLTSEKSTGEFSVITISVKEKIKNSSLYEVIRILLAENLTGKFNFLRHYLVRSSSPTAVRTAFYLELPNLDDNNLTYLFDPKVFELSRHVTFDQEITEVDPYTTACHYTERYVEKGHTANTIVIHVYFNNYGQIVKITGETDNKKQKIIINNANAAREILLKLIAERNTRYEAIVKELNNLEETLNKDYRRIHRQGVNTYLANATIYQELIEELNKLNDKRFDCRGERSKLFCGKLNAINFPPIKKINPREKKKRVVSEETALVVTSTEQQVNSSKKVVDYTDIIMKADKLIDEVKILLNKFIADTEFEVDEVLKLLELIADLNNLLLIFYDADLQKNNQRIKLIENTIDEAYEKIDLLKIFKSYAMQGNYPAVVKIYDKVENHLEFLVYVDLLDKLTSTFDDVEQIALRENLFKIFRFFQETSTKYDIFIAGMNMTCAYFGDESKIGVFFPLRIIMRGDFAVFSMLLEHGLDPNMPGAVSQGMIVPLINIVASSCEDPQYLRELLKYNANVKAPSVPVEEAPNNLKKQIEKKGVRLSRLRIQQQQAESEYPSLPEEFLDCTSSLEAMLKYNPQIKLLRLLAPYYDDTDLFSQLYTMINKEYLVISFVFASNLGGIFCFDEEQAVRTFLQQRITGLGHIAYVLYSKAELMPNEVKEYQVLKALIEICQERVFQDKSSVIKLKNYFFKCAVSTRDPGKAIGYYQNILFVLALGPELDENNYRAVLNSMLKIKESCVRLGVQETKIKYYEKIIANFEKIRDLYSKEAIYARRIKQIEEGWQTTGNILLRNIKLSCQHYLPKYGVSLNNSPKTTPGPNNQKLICW